MNPWFVTVIIAAWFLPLNIGHACCALGRAGEPVVNSDQTVAIVWDPESKTEHLIRKASFATHGADFGFIVPTPTRPELSEAGDAAFSLLEEITRPRSRRPRGFGCSAPSEIDRSSFRPEVTVIERKEVAGFDAVVISANSASSLNEWLKTHGFTWSPNIERWAAPYIRDGWMFTALRVARRDYVRPSRSVESASLRISFKTDRPLFPYREPDSRSAANALSANSRTLCIYFISSVSHQGALENGGRWSGRKVWSGQIDAAHRAELLRRFDLPSTTGPKTWWVTKYADRWPYGVAPGDLYFSPAANHQRLAYEAGDVPPHELDLSLHAGLLIGGLVLVRKRRAKQSVR